MKFAQAFLSAAVGGAALLWAAQATAQTDHPGFATVVRIEGQARYSGPDNVWHPLTVGQTLGPGSVIQSAVGSKVDLVLGDRIAQQIVPAPDRIGPAPDFPVHGLMSYRAAAEQNVISLRSDTVLAIDKLTISNTGIDAVSDTELDLRQGTIFGNVKKLSSASQYLIKTPQGMAGVRGTTFIMSADGDITVISGSMVVVHTDPQTGATTTTVVGPGEQVNPVTGQVTTLTPDQLAAAIQTAIFTITLSEGVITFAQDLTTVVISPTGP